MAKEPFKFVALTLWKSAWERQGEKVDVFFQNSSENPPFPKTVDDPMCQ
jgi:hypothetical protein